MTTVRRSSPDYSGVRIVTSSELVTPGGVAVEQGPEWLARLIYAPSREMYLLAVVLVLLAGVATIYALWRAELDAVTIETIAFNLTILLACGTVGSLFRDSLELPYLLDVASAVIVGVAIAIALRRWCYRPLLEAKGIA